MTAGPRLSWGFPLLLAALSAQACGSPANVLLITLDTTRADRLGAYGGSLDATPNLDLLAAESTVFSDALATASLTPVSHASIFTGQNPYAHGLRVLHGTAQNRLPDEALTLAEILRDRGYATAAFTSAFPVSTHFGLGQGFDTFDESFLRNPAASLAPPDGSIYVGDNQRRSDDTTDSALAWLEKAERPWLAWVHYWDPHDSRILPPEWKLERYPKLRWLRGKNRDRLLYDIEIEYVDVQIGRLLDWLRSTDRLENTIVAVVSDHGESLGEHGWARHGILYRAQIHAVLIIRAPGQTVGRRVDHLVRTIDVAPTILDLIGEPEAAAGMEGISLAPWIEAPAPDPGLVAYADSVNAFWGSPSEKDDLFMLREGKWKYIHHRREDESELYDVDADPGETSNLIREHPERAAALRGALLARSPIPPPQPDPGVGDEPDREELERLERLRALGYVEGE